MKRETHHDNKKNLPNNVDKNAQFFFIQIFNMFINELFYQSFFKFKIFNMFLPYIFESATGVSVTGAQ